MISDMTWRVLNEQNSSVEEIPARADLSPGVTGQPLGPICPDGSLPWSADCGPNGWSAKMYLHQMLSNSLSGWNPSDTERLLSVSTVGTLQVRVAGGNSCSAALLDSPPSSENLYLTPLMVLGLLRRAHRRRRPLQRVLLRTPSGWRRRTLIVTSQAGGYGVSLPKNARPCKDSPEAGLLDFLNHAAGSCSAMPSQFLLFDGSEDGS